MEKADRAALIKAVAVTAELTQTDLSEAAARVMVEDLSRYPLGQVVGALARCRRELKGRLTIADVISRLDDGRPGPEEAWAMIPTDESQSVVWTTEMSQAYGVACPLLERGDKVAARVAFTESYRKVVQIARDEGKAPIWFPSLGTDVNRRATAISDAVDKKRLTPERALLLLPAAVSPDVVARIESMKVAMLAAPKQE